MLIPEQNCVHFFIPLCPQSSGGPWQWEERWLEAAPVWGQVTAHCLTLQASAVAHPGYCNSPCKQPFVKLSLHSGCVSLGQVAHPQPGGHLFRAGRCVSCIWPWWSGTAQQMEGHTVSQFPRLDLTAEPLPPTACLTCCTWCQAMGLWGPGLCPVSGRAWTFPLLSKGSLSHWWVNSLD